MKFNILANLGAGKLRFGMSPSEVEETCGKDYDSFLGRGSSDQYPTFDYSGLGMFCYFDKVGFLEAMEFYEGAEPELDGINLLELTLTEAQAFIRSLGGKVEFERDFARSYDLGVSIWSAHPSDEPVEAVMVFRPGYYDS